MFMQGAENDVDGEAALSSINDPKQLECDLRVCCWRAVIGRVATQIHGYCSHLNFKKNNQTSIRR